MLLIIVVLAMVVAAHEVKKEQKDYFKNDSRKDIRHWLVLIPLFLLASCAATNKTHYERIHGLHKAGVYTVKSRSGNVTTFKEVKGKYVVQSDTLKPNDKIEINVITKKINHDDLSKN